MSGEGMGAFRALPSGFLQIHRTNLQHARFAKTVIAGPARIGGSLADDHVVLQVDIDGLGGLAQLPGLCEAADYGNWTTAQLTRRA